MRRLRPFLWLCLLAPLGVASPAADAAIVVEGHTRGTVFLVEGQQSVAVVPPALPSGATLERVELEYRPGSKVKHRVPFEHLGGDRYAITPQQAALAKIVAIYDTGKLKDDGAKELEELPLLVSIRFAPGVPAGLFVMILAGVILFGGATVSIRSLLRDRDETAP